MSGMSTALLFPGQGSQVRGMGKESFDRFPDLVHAADAILGYSLRELCLDDPRGQLKLTQFTQPALYAVEALDFLRLQKDGLVAPAFAAGHSLGEYAALFAAGVFDFETGLRLVQKRGALMAEAPAGGMAAVLGLSEDRIRTVLRDSGFDGIDVANSNSPTQVAVAGLKQDILAAQTAFEAAGGRYIVLNVGAAFHSRYMKPAQAPFAAFAQQMRFALPRFPVLSNVTARPHDPDTIRDRLVAQIASAVQWTDSVRFLMGKQIAEYREVGPGQVLTRLVQQIRKECTPLVVEAEKAPPAPAKPATAPPQPQMRNGAAKPAGRAGELGAPGFRETYGTRYAYVGGAMMHGEASAEQVIALTGAGMLGIYGADGVATGKVATDLRRIRTAIGDRIFGVSLMADWSRPERDMERIEQYLREDVRLLEVSGFVTASPALVRFRLKGVSAGGKGQAVPRHRILARVTRPAAALLFLQPAPASVVEKLRALGHITEEEARLAGQLPLADDICAQADGSGPSDGGNLLSLLPSVCRLRDEQQQALRLSQPVRVGAAGSLGTPEAMAAAFLLGADFVLAAAIHQCSPEAGTSAMVKEMLQAIDVADTDRAPSGELFEQNGQIQVLRKGVFFPARANKLHSLWRHHASLDEIDATTRRQIEDKMLGCSFEQVWADLQRDPCAHDGSGLERATRDPKARMALIFRTYFDASLRAALSGDAGQRVNFQVHCSSGLGALNRWLGNVPWQQRSVAEIAGRLMAETAALLQKRGGQLWRAP